MIEADLVWKTTSVELSALKARLQALILRVWRRKSALAGRRCATCN
ncbi:MAG: hypothetical protein NTW45_03860 [Rhodocyclales bacterium]|nr:hypothetical protein [Rhodocyclales bacterium]